MPAATNDIREVNCRNKYGKATGDRSRGQPTICLEIVFGDTSGVAAGGSLRQASCQWSHSRLGVSVMVASFRP